MFVKKEFSMEEISALVCHRFIGAFPNKIVHAEYTSALKIDKENDNWSIEYVLEADDPI